VDRFDSRETVDWNEGAYRDGYEARSVYDAAITEAPSAEVIGDWCHKSWKAGWADADMDKLICGDCGQHLEACECQRGVATSMSEKILMATCTYWLSLTQADVTFEEWLEMVKKFADGGEW
jgi:hypothetical protein